MRNLVGPTDRPTIVALVTRNQVTSVALVARVADATPNQVGVPQIIRYAILARAMRASVKLMPVERPRRLPHRRTQTVPRALRLLAELVEGPAVRAARGTLKFFTGEALEKRVTHTVARGPITITSIGTLEGRVGLIRGAGHVGPRRRGDAGSMLTC